ncbi:hypothetical protein MNBD_GAMMA11-1215 [hydrothermal vent metagenome]|uniref:Anti sigma-E protein RseA N-terminal domain-containing protein n=1 Tax=hydrothermal vent metagenome TaxID=652676 RepID=A0A3B0XIH3_9ZZZZ
MKQTEIKPKREEQLSALLDNALDAQQLQGFMQDLKRDPLVDAETAQRYQLIGDVMRDDVDQISFMDISDAVHRSIELEPEHHVAETPTVKHKSSRHFLSPLYGWLKPVGGLAVAASVATMTLLTFNSLQTDSSDPDEAAQFVQQSQPVQLVNPEIARNVRVASTGGTDKKTPEQQQQLNLYMLRHSGVTSHTAIQEMMPNVRVIEFKVQEKK